jgi:hypothetical protein
MKTPKRSGRQKQTAGRPKAPSVRTLERRIARLTAAHEAALDCQARRLAVLRRAHDRRMAGLVQEIARLRHHEARTEALARLVAERDVALAAQAQRIVELEALLRDRAGLA